MIDLHYAMMLSDAWDTLKADTAAWRELMPPLIADSVQNEWHATLFPGGRSIVRFGQSWDTKQAKTHQVIIGLQDNASETQPLGFAVGLSDAGVPQVGIMADESILVNVYGPHKELVRAIWWAVRGITIQYGHFMLRAGYDNFSYVGGGDLMGEQGFAFEQLGVYVRTTRWRYTETICVPSKTIPAITSMIVAHVDSYVDGNVGGGSPS